MTTMPTPKQKRMLDVIRSFTGANGYYGPAKNTAVDWIHLPLQVGWFKRVGIKYGTPEYKETFLRACELINKKFNEWKLTQKRAVFINKADEPHDFETLELGKVHADFMWEAREKYGLKVYFRMDVGGLADHGAGHFKENWTVDSVLDYFQDRVQIWNFNPSMGSFPKKDGRLYDFRKARNCQYWLYASNTHGEPAVGNIQIDCERIGVLNWLWSMWKYRVDGGMFWETVFWSKDDYIDTLWTRSLHDDRENPPGNMNGDATALAPGKFVLKNNRPLPGVRLKLIRRASQDYEYFHLLSEKLGSKKRADSLVNAIIPHALWDVPPVFRGPGEWKKHRKGKLHPDDPKFTYMHGKWSHNPEKWIAARHAVWEMLEGMK